MAEIKRASLQPELEFAWQKFFSKPCSRDRFLVYLVEVYHYVKHTCPLMELARDRAEHTFPAYFDYLQKHIEEESGHENWVLKDLSHLGLDYERIIRSTPFRSTINLVGSQLYILRSETPEAYLGYIYTMEGNTATLSRLDELCAMLDIRSEHLSALYLHSTIDIEHHIVDLKNWLDEHLSDTVRCHAVLENMERASANVSDLVLNLAYLEEDLLNERLDSLGLDRSRHTPCSSSRTALQCITDGTAMM